MGREFELKYRCDRASFDAIKEDFGELTPISMETTYYDTFDGKLSNVRWTLRRRFENGRSICTLKTPDPEGGRGEWEVEAAGIMEGIPKLCQLGAPLQLMALTVSGLQAVCGARFTRLMKQIAVPGGVIELALDQGALTGGGRESLLLEVEVELKSGPDEIALTFAAELVKKYGLTPEPKSKYRRALELARGA